MSQIWFTDEVTSYIRRFVSAYEKDVRARQVLAVRMDTLFLKYGNILDNLAPVLDEAIKKVKDNLDED